MRPSAPVRPSAPAHEEIALLFRMARSFKSLNFGIVNARIGWRRANPFVFLVAWTLLPLLLSFILIHQLDSFYRSPWGFALIVALVSAGLLTYGWRAIWTSLTSLDWSGNWRPHWAWGLVALALALRYILLDYLPPPHPILEEIQTGGIAAGFLRHGELPLDFRFTNWMAAAGFHIGGYSLEAMRSLFGVAGALSILVMALTLRRLDVGWPATILAVFTMASLRILVLGGNTAEEIFGGIVFAAILFYCVVCSHTSRDNQLVWAGFAGIMAGVLMYEYAPYKWLIVVPVLAWFWPALTDRDGEARRTALWAGSCYMLCLTLVGAVVFADLLDNPKTSYLLDIYFRHTHDRPFPLTDLTELKRSGMKMWDYVQVLIGQSETPAPLTYRQPHGPVVPGLVGLMFAAGFLYVLWRPRLLLLRIAALVALLTVALFGLVANNFNVGILVPIAVLLILFSAVAADALVQRLRASDRFRPAVLYLPALIGLIVVINVLSVTRMAADPAVLREFGNNQYSVCRAISEEPLNYQSVYLTSYGGHCGHNDEKWMYPDREAPIAILDELPAPADIPLGSLVVVGHSHGLPADKISELTQLAVRMRSEHTLRNVQTLLSETAAVSFCYQCAAEP